MKILAVQPSGTTTMSATDVGNGHAPTGRRVSNRAALGLQARALSRTLLDRDEPYAPLRWK